VWLVLLVAEFADDVGVYRQGESKRVAGDVKTEQTLIAPHFHHLFSIIKHTKNVGLLAVVFSTVFCEHL
jgi:hypothetical protein